MIAVFHLNAGSSATDERALEDAIATSRNLVWAESPAHADVFVITGPIPQGIRPAVALMWRDWIAGRAPLVAVGRASIDGHPFGRGGITEMPEIQVAAKIDGDPPIASAIQAGIQQALQQRLHRH